MDDKELGIEHRYIDLDEVYLHYVEAGSGPLVVLLHGFPEFWYSWRYQIPALAKAGFRVVAPDMRGYNISGKPRGVKAYHIAKLTGDVAKLIEKLGSEKAVVVGHDWGAMVAWVFAMQYPQLLERLVILNVPHPVRFEKGLRTPQQLLKSWYTFFFQLPFLPEFFSRLFDYQVFRQTFKRDPVRSGAFTSEDVEKYVQAIAQPGALTAGINYYRAIMRAQLIWKDRPPYRKIEVPVLVIWGDQDRYLGKELAEPSAEWVPQAEVHHLRAASHWVQLDSPEQVNELIINFLSR